MKTKILLVHNILYQLIRLIMTINHRNCARLRIEDCNKSCLEFNAWEMIKTVYVFYRKNEELDLEIANKFPNSNVCDCDTGLTKFKAECLAEKKSITAGDKVVFVLDPLDTKNIIMEKEVCRSKLKPGGPIDYLSKLFSQKKVTVFPSIYANEKIIPIDNFHRILIEPPLIKFKLKANIEELIGCTLR